MAPFRALEALGFNDQAVWIIGILLILIITIPFWQWLYNNVLGGEGGGLKYVLFIVLILIIAFFIGPYIF